MDAEVPVLSGYLNIPSQSGFPLNRISKKKSCSKYCLLFSSSRHGIERLEIFESKDDKNPKIITLENCVKITQEPAPANLIQIVKKSGTLTLNTLNDEDLREWIKALQTVAFRDKSGPIIEEDNDLYCSSFDGLFIITLIPSETSIRCNLNAKTYMLHLTATELQLKSTDDLNIISKWPYRYIRKYGYRDGKFTFEAGRKCDTGEGVFILDHSNPQEIFRSMSTKMKSMKKLINGDGFNNDSENQLSAAASMEAGSRSPLPPTLSLCSSEFETNSTQSLSVNTSSLSNDFNKFSIAPQSNNTFNSIKSIPHKPPRKLPCSDKLPVQIHSTVGMPTLEKTKKFQNYEPVAITSSVDPNKVVCSSVLLNPPSPDVVRQPTLPPELPLRNENNKNTKADERNYESIETITDAWKTLGINEINHTERCAPFSKENQNDINWQRLQNKDTSITSDTVLTPKPHKIVDIDIGEQNSIFVESSKDTDYDRLNFLLPNNKSGGGYKTIVSVTPSTHWTREGPKTPNEYEIIASPDIQISRKADDTHLGYGIIRRPNLTTPPVGKIEQTSIKMLRTTNSTEEPLDHQSFNGLNYTIVSKPKRV